MSEIRRDILDDAIARNSTIVVSLPSAGMLRHYKSRFLGESPEGVWVEADTADRPLIDELLATQASVGVSFKRGSEKVVFSSPLLEYDSAYSINDQTAVAALLVARPDEIKAVQRRDNYRVRVFPNQELHGRVWRVAPRVSINDRPMPSQQVMIEIRDLSLGGMGVAISGTNGQPPKITLEDRLRVELQYKDTTLLLEGRIRPPTGPQPTGGISTGIQFNEMAGDLEGRRKLGQMTRILSELQRQEVRRSYKGTG